MSIYNIFKIELRLIGLSSVTLGYQINILIDPKYDLGTNKHLFVYAGVLVFLSITIGLGTAYNRLLDGPPYS